MALFKIFKGLKDNLPKDKYTDGWCYFTTDDGKMYIDTKNDDPSGRVVLNAGQADKLSGTGTIQINLESNESSIYTNGGDITPGVSGILQPRNGGTGNATGRVQIGQKEGETIGDNATSEGTDTIASNYQSHAEGYQTVASGHTSHAEGRKTKASNHYTHAEGNLSIAAGEVAHAEGNQTAAYGQCSHAEGAGDVISIYITGNANSLTYTLSEENTNIQVGQMITYNGIQALITAYDPLIPSITTSKSLNNTSITNAEATIYQTTASNQGSHSEGRSTLSSGQYAHAEGGFTVASGFSSHAEGSYTKASGSYSHAEGSYTNASGSYSHAEGYGTIASGSYSHAGGYHTKTSGDYSTIFGERSDNKTILLSGNANALTYSINLSSTTLNYTTLQGSVSSSGTFTSTVLPTASSSSPSSVTIQNTKVYTLTSGSYLYSSYVTSFGVFIPNVYLFTSRTGNTFSGLEKTYKLNTDLKEIITVPENSTYYIVYQKDWTSYSKKSTSSGYRYSYSSNGQARGGLSIKGVLNVEDITLYQNGYFQNGQRIVSVSTADNTITLDRTLSTSSISYESFTIYLDRGAKGKASFVTGLNNSAKGEYQTVIGKNNLEDTTSAFIIGNGNNADNFSNAYTIDWNGNSVQTGTNTSTNFIGPLTGNADTATKLSSAKTIELTGNVTGSTVFDGNENVAIQTTVNRMSCGIVGSYDNPVYFNNGVPVACLELNPTLIGPGKIGDRGLYISSHPETTSTIIPFINNDIAHLIARGGSCVLKINDVDQNIDFSNNGIFDGTPNYGYIASLNDKNDVITLELTLHRDFEYSNKFYIDFGNEWWAPSNIKMETLYSKQEGDVWQTKFDLTNQNIKSVFTPGIFNHQPLGQATDHPRFNKIRITLSGFQHTHPRIAEIGLIGYDSKGVAETYLSRGGGTVYGDITAQNFIGNVTGNATTATALTSNAGNSNTPVYFNEGKPIACTGTTVPAGGSAGQALVKKSTTDGDASWVTQTITLTGDVTGSATLGTDGSASISTTVGDNSHNHTWSNISDSASCTINTSGTITATKVYGAVWNDYAEYRNQKEYIEPGYCVASANNGQVYKTTEKFQACDGIVSDTFGFAIGETNECKTPLAVAGRVLAYFNGNREDYQAGDTVCAGPEGKVIKMTREEIREWPDRIIGIVSEIPEYETWGSGNIKVNNRIWIKIK